MIQMTKHRFAAIAALLVAGAATAVAQRHGRAFGFHAGSEQRFEMLADHLSLDETQRASAKKILDEAKAASQPVVAQLKQGHDDMATAVKNNAPETRFDDLGAAQGKLVGQLAAIHGRSFAKVYALLTPEQRAKADKMHERMRAMMRRGFGGQ